MGSFEWLDSEFHPQTQKLEPPYTGKYCSVGFHLNGHTLEFHPETQNLEPAYTT